MTVINHQIIYLKFINFVLDANTARLTNFFQVLLNNFYITLMYIPFICNVIYQNSLAKM